MDQENRLSIGKINGVEIYAVKKEDGTVLVPIKPICKAIGIDSEDELQRIQGDRRLLRASVTITTEGNGGRELEMLCLPLKETLGWIFSIQSFMVDESIRDQVEKYRDECYDAIYGRLQGDSVRLIKARAALKERVKSATI